MSIIEDKVNGIIADISKVSEQIGKDIQTEIREDGSAMLYGPFPSFLILVEELGATRAVVHVNSDAANMAWLFTGLLKIGVDIPIDGAFAVDKDGAVLLGHAAYAKKEDNILEFAGEILERRGFTPGQPPKDVEKKIIVPEKKIILGA